MAQETIVSHSYAGIAGGGLYADERSRLDLSGVSFVALSSGVSCPQPSSDCVSYNWTDSAGDDCEAYGAYADFWCGFEESNDKCCACGGGQKSCETTGVGGGYYAASLATVTMRSVEFQRLEY